MGFPSHRMELKSESSEESDVATSGTGRIAGSVKGKWTFSGR